MRHKMKVVDIPGPMMVWSKTSFDRKEAKPGRRFEQTI